MTKYEPVFFDIETTGLNPMAQGWMNQHSHDASVLAVGLAYLTDWRKGDETIHVEVLSVNGNTDNMMHDEHMLLEDLKSRMSGLRYDIESEGREMLIAGFNSRQFDHPYIAARFARHRIDPWPFVSSRKRLDMKRPASSWLIENVGEQNYHGNSIYYPSQDDFMECMGIESEDDITGKDVPRLYDEGRMDKVKKHVHWDVKELALAFVEEKDLFMQHFYDHYDMDRESNFRGEVSL